MNKLFRYLKCTTFAFTAISMLLACRSIPVSPPKIGLSEVDNIILVDPYTEIRLIEKDQFSQYNDSLSYLVSRLIKDAFAQNRWIPVTDTISIRDETILSSYQLFQYQIKNASDGYQVTVPSELNTLIKSSGHRFGMLLWANGYERTKDNYSKIEALNIAVCILSVIVSFGTLYYYPMTYKGSLRLYVAIIDTDDGRIVYYNTALLNDSRPTDYTFVLKAIRTLFS